jgi:hypothetical protein
MSEKLAGIREMGEDVQEKILFVMEERRRKNSKLKA